MTWLRLALAALLSLSCAAPDFYLGGIQVNESDHAVWIDSLDRAGMNTVAVTVYAHQGDWDSANLWWSDEEPWVVHEVRAAKARGLKVVLVLRVALDHAFERNKFFWHGMIMPRTPDDLEEWFRRYAEFAAKWAAIAAREGIDVLAIGSEMNTLTNTIPVDEVPNLEEYWSNPEKVERESEKILRHADEIESRHLEVRGYSAYTDLRQFLGEEGAAQAAWARRVAFLEEDDPVAAMNLRRTRLDDHWRAIVQRARSLYPGPITYAANFDQYELVGFWDALDLIAINAYFPLGHRLLPRGSEADLLARLEARWRAILGSIDRFRIDRGVPDHPVLFTELGYVARENSTLAPWDSDGFTVVPSPEGPRLMVWKDQPEDPVERALAVRALYEANLDLSADLGAQLLCGILYWKLSTYAGHRKEEPFVLILETGDGADPLLGELQRFGRDLSQDLWQRRAQARWRSALESLG